MSRFAALSLLTALALPAGFAAAQPAPPSKSALKQGEAIAKNNCGACHAVGRRGASPNPKSPPFRSLARRYPLANLEEALGEGIVVGHEGLDMPQFRFETGEVEALLAYLASIQKR
ncbi:cytochrome c [Methylocystis echinoides]|jgi:mono/diheme cytochrome c family protein|uniref:c-type cytochrome n=1 Tax=Methylocystis echinoides TaxID=29468 RepID=UPI00341C62BF